MKTLQIWETYQDEIRRFIKSKVRDNQITDDLIQETFVKAHNNIGRLKNDSKIKPWLFTIARNTVYDFYKENRYTVDFEDVDEKVSEESDSNHVHTEKDCLPGLINALPQKYRIPLLLSDIKGLKQDQIAKQLGVPLPTIKSQIQRARKMLIKGYMNCCDYKLNDKGQLVGEAKDKEGCKICR
ncbi:sigma-70 family RNA polymerase sigma factor [Aquimarina sediminis]|uniref:sigma-70 family RNA polymerase sigma factor n=1 Tax=Aquimarina sediminis TaxID=2070536 RepID=UPI000CA0328A|nr:sigma-70 family RNA polymerase sigma factor [Aquimarina sediminis]